MQRNIDMTMNTYEFLHFVNFKDIPNWSVQYTDEIDLGFTNKYPMARIGSFLHKSRDIIEVQDNVEYKQVTIKINNGGVVPRNDGNTVKGAKIGTKRQYVVHAGQFIMSKIDARNGAYGIVPEELEGAIVTNDFPVFSVDTDRIIPQFLVLISTTDKFIDFARKCSSGTTNRKRIDIDNFLLQQIPLPNIKEQRKILAEYNSALEKANKIISESHSEEDKIFDYLLSKLNIETNTKEEQNSNSFLSFTLLSKIDRWDCYKENYIINRKGTMTLGQLVKSKPFYGAPYSAVKYNNKIRYIRITDINEDGSLVDDPEKIVSANSYNKNYLLRDNDFLIARSGNTVGKTFLYSEKMGPAIFAGYLIKFEINEEIILPQYLLLYTKSSIFKKWIKANMRISAQPNINSKQYLSAPIVVPDMSVQKDIVSFALRKKEEIKNSLLEAYLIKEKANNMFNQTIFE